MNNFILPALLLISLSGFAQNKNKKPITGIGLKAGINFANVTNVSSINNSRRTGFMIGAYINPPSRNIISSVTEIVYSRQGYQFSTGTNTGNVNLNYILVPQLMGINITKVIQLQVGFQIAYLLNAAADSSNSGTGTNPYGQLMDYYNRFDYAATGGVEIHPFRNLIIGARINISFGNIYKDPLEFPPGGSPSFIPEVDVRNNVLQLFAGLRF